MDKIEKIRQEIERLKGQLIRGACAAQIEMETNCKNEAYNEVLAFLDTLSEESVALNKVDKIKQILRLSVEYYKQEVFGKFDTEDMTEEREDHRAKWILERLPNEPDSEDLEEEVKNYFQGYWPGTETAEQCNTDLHFTPLAIMRLARHFANWQKEQFEKNRLAHCDGLTKEEYDRETDFAMEIIEKEHRQPTFIDAINYGMRLQAEKDKDTIELAEDHAYFAGAVNERKHMMKQAVEAEVNTYRDLTAGKSWAEFVVEMPTDNLGDEVRIIVLPKED